MRVCGRPTTPAARSAGLNSGTSSGHDGRARAYQSDAVASLELSADAEVVGTTSSPPLPPVLVSALPGASTLTLTTAIAVALAVAVAPLPVAVALASALAFAS